LSHDQILGIKNILTSITVLDLSELRGGLVNKSSYDYYTDGQGNGTISFEIEYTDPIRIQRK
jgi:hypothetical protein